VRDLIIHICQVEDINYDDEIFNNRRVRRSKKYINYNLLYHQDRSRWYNLLTYSLYSIKQLIVKNCAHCLEEGAGILNAYAFIQRGLKSRLNACKPSTY
jgi:hypothetical protein